MASQAFERIRDALTSHGSRVTGNRQGEFKAQCPHHDDHDPSLSVTDKGDRVLVHCHAHCGADEVMADLGLTLADLFDGEPSKDRALPIRSYCYEQPNGNPWFWKDRYWPKTFICRLPGTEPGDRTGLKGRNANLLYHAPQLVAGVKAGKTIWLVDGEKDVETAERHGLVATTTPHGAGSRWDPKYTEAMTGAAEVIIVVDQDKAKVDGTLGTGQQHAIEARAGLRSAGVKVRMVAPAVGKDLTDHFDAGYTAADFVPDASVYTRPRGVTGAVLTEMVFAPVTYAVEHVLPPGLAILAGSPKFGKMQRLSTPVLTPTGWTTMGTLRVGDEVVGRNGHPTKVIGVHPQGVQPIYRVTCSDGAFTECGGSHLWNVQTHGQRVRQARQGRQLWTTRTTNEIADMLRRGVTRSLHLPIVDPVEFTVKPDLGIDPYVLGLLLGDGCFAGDLTFTKNDRELWDVLAEALPEQVLVPRNSRTVAITRGPMRGLLRGYGLWGKRSWEKWIPDDYLVAPVESRLALLQGLLDTDGWVETNSLGNTLASFCTSSPRLAEQVVELVESLGGVTRRHVRQEPRFQNGIGRPAHVIRIRLPQQLEPFRLGRKRDAWRAGRTTTNRPPDRSIVAVEYVDDDDAVCITVAAQDGLYVTERYLVTHNSFCALSMGLGVAAGGRAMDQLECNQGSVLYLAREDSARRIQARIGHLYQNCPPTHLEHIEIVPAEQSWTGGEIGLEAMTEWAEQVGNPRLVVLDTWAKVDPLVDDRDRYRTEYRLMASYKQWGDLHSCTVLLVHHLRKSTDGDGDPFSEISGTRGITGAADTLIVMKAKRGSREGVMYLTGRDVAEQELELRKYGPLWVCVDRPDSV